MVDITFQFAVVHWLAHFPNSPLLENDRPSSLSDPETIYKLLEVLLDEDLSFSKCSPGLFRPLGMESPRIGFHELSPVVKQQVCLQFDAVFVILEKFKLDKKINYNDLYLDMVDIEKLYDGDLNQVDYLCKILVSIGISSKMSAFGITLLSFLDDEDRREVKSFINEERGDYKFLESGIESNESKKESFDMIENDQLKSKLEEQEEKYERMIASIKSEHEIIINELRFKCVDLVEENLSLQSKYDVYRKKYDPNTWKCLQEELSTMRQKQLVLNKQIDSLKRSGNIQTREIRNKEIKQKLSYSQEIVESLIWENKSLSRFLVRSLV